MFFLIEVSEFIQNLFHLTLKREGIEFYSLSYIEDDIAQTVDLVAQMDPANLIIDAASAGDKLDEFLGGIEQIPTQLNIFGMGTISEQQLFNNKKIAGFLVKPLNAATLMSNFK